MSKKIGIIGSGVVAQTLASGFLKHNYRVTIGSNHPEKQIELRSRLPNAEVGGFEQAAKFGEIIVLAVKGSAAESVVESVGINNLKGKTIIDTTNPIADLPPVNGVLQCFTQMNGSLMERLQKSAPQANFVKAFSCIGYAFMVNPDFNGQKPTMYICGNSEEAKQETVSILNQFGWDDVEDMGAVEAARAIEPLVMLWCLPGFLHNRWTHAFKLLKL